MATRSKDYTAFTNVLGAILATAVGALGTMVLKHDRELGSQQARLEAQSETEKHLDLHLGKIQDILSDIHERLARLEAKGGK